MNNKNNVNQDLSQEEILRYSRHLLIPDVGVEGQKKLKASSVLIIGAGGLGSPVAMYLAAAGVGRIGLVDFDIVDFSNLQRQIIHGKATIGDLKVDSARARLQDINSDIEIEAINQAFTSENALEIADGYDLIIDGTDNFPTRYLVNDVSYKLGIPNVYGSIFRFDGQLSVFNFEGGPCYRCIFPVPPPPGLVPSCAEGGVFGVLPGTIGTLQTNEALKILLGIGTPISGSLLLYDALQLSFYPVKIHKDPECLVCSRPSDEVALMDYEQFCGLPGHNEVQPISSYDIQPLELVERIASNKSLQLIDVREPHELQISSIPQAELIPLGQLASRLHELNSTNEIVVFCKGGTRSARAVELLHGAGLTNSHNLVGGINAWAEEVDPSLPIY